MKSSLIFFFLFAFLSCATTKERMDKEWGPRVGKINKDKTIELVRSAPTRCVVADKFEICSWDDSYNSSTGYLHNGQGQLSTQRVRSVFSAYFDKETRLLIKYDYYGH